MAGWLKGLKGECLCADCSQDDEEIFRELKKGCLKHWACLEVFSLIGHAIAEGFGADDVSGGGSQEMMAKEVMFLLIGLLVQKEVKWNQWFGVAAMYTTGCDTICRDSPGGRGLTELAAFQYGGLSVVASWLKVDQRLQIPSCFSFQCATASIAGMSDNTGYLHCEGCHPSSAPLPKPADGAWKWSETLEDDETRATVKSVIFRTEVSSYRLILLVETPSTDSTPVVRHFDPSMALVGLCHAKWATCNCTEGDTSEVPGTKEALRVSTFEMILKDWDPLHRSGMEASKALRSYLKINIALSLCNMGSVLRTKGCCEKCAARAVSELPCPEYLAVLGIPLRIITAAIEIDDADRLLGPPV
jgi:hypothetical protein